MLVVASQDGMCISQLADGDEAALADVFDRYAPSVYALLQAILGASYEAQEQLHELFLELWRTAPTWGLQAPQPLRTWLLLRARQRALAVLAEQPELAEHASQARLLPARWRVVGRYDAALLDDPHLGRDRARQRRVLAQLTRGAQRLVALSYLRGLKARALADAVDQPTRHACRRLAFAYEALHDVVHDEAPEV